MTDIKQDVMFEYTEEMTDEILLRLEDGECENIAAIGKYDEIRQVIEHLFREDNVSLENLELASADNCGYGGEYIAEIYEDDGRYKISCEKAMRDGKYLNFENDVIYIFDNCNSRIISRCSAPMIYFVSIGDEDDDFESDSSSLDEAEYEKLSAETDTENEGVRGFSVSKYSDGGYVSYSFYTDRTLSQSDIENIINKKINQSFFLK